MLKHQLFAGCHITSELRLQLSRSSLWKQAKITSQDLVETHFQEKDFIGLFLSQEVIQLIDLKEIEKKICEALKTYCPEFPSEKIHIHVFSQLFIL